MATTVHRVALVDDDPELRQLTAAYLQRHGIEVTEYGSADAFLRRLPRLRPDLVVLDLMLPGTDGLSACRQLRAAGDDLPIVMLTARGDDIDRIVGLEMGADDYLAKPFNPRELLARIHVVLRRRRAPGAAPDPDAAPVAIGAWTFDAATRTLTGEGRTVLLTDSEHALLRALTDHPFRPLSRDRLLELTRGRADSADDRSIDVAIHRLRKLVEPQPQSPRYLQTLRGQGYVFVPGAP